MSCYNCTGCTPTKDLTACFADITFGQFANGTVELTFTSTADGSKSFATGTASGGSLTILAANLPDFVNGRAYKVTASAQWTLDSVVVTCVTIRVALVRGVGGFISGTNEVLQTCD